MLSPYSHFLYKQTALWKLKDPKWKMLLNTRRTNHSKTNRKPSNNETSPRLAKPYY